MQMPKRRSEREFLARPKFGVVAPTKQCSITGEWYRVEIEEERWNAYKKAGVHPSEAFPELDPPQVMFLASRRTPAEHLAHMKARDARDEARRLLKAEIKAEVIAELLETYQLRKRPTKK